MRMIIFILCVLVLSGPAAAQTDPEFDAFLTAERDKLPLAGKEIYNGADMGGYRFSGGSGAIKRIVDVDADMPFGKALQLSVQGAGANPWEPQLQTRGNQIEIEEGDYLFYIFYVRVLESEAEDGLGKSLFYVQRSNPPWTGQGSMSLSIRPAWHKYYVVAQAKENFAKNQMEVTMHLGYFKQKVEVSGIIGLNLGKNIKPENLPQTPIYYNGMEPDAAWRAAAQSRIEEYRMGDITVNVKNVNGQAVKNALVNVQMLDHAYGFGTFISEMVIQDNADAENYVYHLEQMFNRATTPFYMGGNGDNWGWYGASGHSRKVYPQMASWLQERNIPTKGHVLIWPGWQWMPSFFEDLKNNPAALRQAIDDHLEDVVPIGKENGLVEWDVVNEPHVNHDVMDILGEEVLIEWYKRVNEIDPNPRLILNEYNILSSGGQQAFQDNLARVVELLQAGGAPIGGIGMQCHFDANLTGIPRVLSILDRFAQYGIPIQITEFDIDIFDQETQADYLRDFYTAVFSHPATDKIVMWGFWETTMWKPKGALIRPDWSYKPNYYAYTNLLYEKWWTDNQGVTDRNGVYQTRGFLGQYSVKTEFDGAVDSKQGELNRDGLTVDLVVQTTETDVESAPKNPHEYGLKDNHPNPFNASTVIEFIPPSSGDAVLTVYDVRGTQVFKEPFKVKKGVAQRKMLSLQEQASGPYFYAVEWADGTKEIKKMMLLR